MKKSLALALVGGSAAASAQRFMPTGWWLNTGQGVVLTSFVLALLAALIAGTAAQPVRARSVLRAVALWAGANVGLAIVLIRVGPGNIFPIVLVFGAGISAIAVGAGSFVAYLLRTAWARSTHS